MRSVFTSVDPARATVRYVNWRGPAGLETVDEFTPEPGQSPRDFREYVRRMVAEYHAAGMAVYTSTRPCKAWAAQ